ncbi:MAG: DUF3098 domain-containing protein [Tannerella sp.]|jgi:uncharacterized membrane protein|nr:DUF3098 domain-containing protein [Tannerella sp.]MDR1225047.1 DUF3098 domain-containing protein [Tannerella sp.]
MKDFAFGKENFIVIAVAVVLIIIGFVMMSGGGSEDGVSFNPAIFSKQRIVVAPVITVLGFALVVIGILRKPKDHPVSDAEKKKA